MRRAAKTDANHTSIVNTLRASGISVHDTSAVGQGFPDLVCGYGGRSFLVEIKDGSKPPSRRRLTPDQEAFRVGWRGHYVVIESESYAQLWAIGITKET
jgi:hypothetical protein